MRNIVVMCVAVAMTMMSTACAADHSGHSEQDGGRTVIEAFRTANPVVVDGVLDERVWEQAKTYELGFAADVARSGASVQEGGKVQLAWDEKYLYVAVRFTDSDIVAEGDEDQLHHYAMGDLCELFLKPAGATWYWELYVTPRSKKSSFWFPGRGRFGLPSNFEYDCDLDVAAQVNGTTNDWRDKDHHWTAEMAMPIADLTAQGDAFGPGHDWRILLARYNYGRYRVERGPELTMTPSLSATNFHLLEDYAQLKLVE